MMRMIMRIRSTLNNEKGSVLLIVAAGMIVLMVMTALVIDIGYVHAEKRHLQNTADAAALAGARELVDGNAANVTTVVETYVDVNGITLEEIAGIAQEEDRVTVTLRGSRNLFIARVFGVDTMTVEASATAMVGNARSVTKVLPIGLTKDGYENVLASENPLFGLVGNDPEATEIGPGNWGFTYMDGSNTTGTQQVNYMEMGGYEGNIYVGMEISTDTGANVLAELKERTYVLDSLMEGEMYFVPVYEPTNKDKVAGKTVSEIVGFAAIRIVSYDIPNPAKTSITAELVSMENIFTGGGIDLTAETLDTGLKSIALTQ
mgnify:CR=1 FL=1